jgi:glyoxylase-like metal-dependent hydrolase (beta-lactamase superfamily II)
MKIIPLSEGSFTIDKTKIFVPFQHNEHELNDRPVGSLLVEVQPFVVVTSQDILLLDTGLGFMQDGKLQIHQNLAEHGINPGDITKVLMTHLHKDHAGGVGIVDKLGHHSLSFPSAQYYVQQAELDFAFEKGFPSFMTDELSILQENGKVELLNGNGIIDDYIRYEVTGGHSPHHQAFWIEEDGKIVFFGGDEAPQLQQMKSKFVAKYDHDGKRAMELRQQWWQKGQADKWTFLFYHDIKKPLVDFSS